MSEAMVRARWMTSVPGFMKLHFPSDVGTKLFHGLPEAVRRSISDLEPVQWCPRSHHVAVLDGVVALHRSENEAYEALLAYGQYVAGQILHGPFRPFMQVATLRLFAKSLPQFWAQDHSDGSRLDVDISSLDEAKLSLRISGVAGYNHAGVAMLGWVKGALAQFCPRPVQVKQAGWTLSQPGPKEIQGEMYWS